MKFNLNTIAGRLSKSLGLAVMAFATLAFTSCDDNKSYAELLTDENHAVNTFLSDQIVELSIPEDTVFQVGPDAPYYQLDEEGNLYMQVLNAGTKGNRVTDDQLIYFRFTRYSLSDYAADGELGEGWGNANDLSYGSASFRYGNYTLTSSSQWGSGIQTPLTYLPIDCEVNIIIKSQYGLSSEISSVIPFLYNIRYFPALSN